MSVFVVFERDMIVEYTQEGKVITKQCDDFKRIQHLFPHTNLPLTYNKTKLLTSSERFI